MGFAEEYRSKLTTAEEAVKVVKSGDWVDYGWCTATAKELDEALAKRTGGCEAPGRYPYVEACCFRCSRGCKAFYMEFVAYVWL